MNALYLRNDDKDIFWMGDLAKEIFPELNLTETIEYSDSSDENDILEYLIEEIKGGRYEKLYLKDISELSKDISQAFNILNDLAQYRPNFKVQFQNLDIIEVKDIDFELCKQLENGEKIKIENICDIEADGDVALDIKM